MLNQTIEISGRRLKNFFEQLKKKWVPDYYKQQYKPQIFNLYIAQLNLTAMLKDTQMNPSVTKKETRLLSKGNKLLYLQVP